MPNLDVRPKSPNMGLADVVFLTEFINAARTINDLLLAGIKWMAGRANFNAKVFSKRRTGLKRVTAAAGNINFIVLRVNISFHYDNLKNGPGVGQPSLRYALNVKGAEE